MFKLLTEEAMKKVTSEYKRRRTVVVLLALILALLISVVGILPSYVLSTIRQFEIEEKSKITNSAKTKGDEQELDAWLAKTNNILASISPDLEMPPPSELIEKVIDEKTSGVSLTSFSWKEDKEKPVMIVRGLASSRANLILFRDNLNDSGHFSSVELPISDLALDKNIDFQISLSPIQIQ